MTQPGGEGRVSTVSLSAAPLVLQPRTCLVCERVGIATYFVGATQSKKGFRILRCWIRPWIVAKHVIT